MPFNHVKITFSCDRLIRKWTCLNKCRFGDFPVSAAVVFSSFRILQWHRWPDLPLLEVWRNITPSQMPERSVERSPCWGVGRLILSSTISVPQNTPAITHQVINHVVLIPGILTEFACVWQGSHGNAPNSTPVPSQNTQPAIMKPTEEPPAYSQQQTQVLFPVFHSSPPSFLQPRLCLPPMLRGQRNQAAPFMWCL